MFQVIFFSPVPEKLPVCLEQEKIIDKSFLGKMKYENFDLSKCPCDILNGSN